MLTSLWKWGQTFLNVKTWGVWKRWKCKERKKKAAVDVFCSDPDNNLSLQYWLLRARHQWMNHWVHAISWSNTGEHNELSEQKPIIKKKNTDLEKCDMHDQRIIRLIFHGTQTPFIGLWSLQALRHIPRGCRCVYRAWPLDRDWDWLLQR